MSSIRQWIALSVLVGLVWAGWPEAGYAKDVRKPDILTQAQTLGELTDLVRRQYYEDTDPVELYHGAIEGYLSHLDPHSTYITPEELQDTQERLRGSFEGIGIYFDILNNYLTVLSPIEGAPAYQVGLMAGDRIVKIDGRSSIGIKASEVTRRLKGPKGSRVKVTVQREGTEDLLEFEIVRDRIEVPSVPYAFRLQGETGYVKVNRFSSHTSTDLQLALEDLKAQGIERLVLDLRGNGGGYLEQAVAVANQFVEKEKLLVYTEGRHGKDREDHFARNGPVLPPDMPMMVLVDSYSASASEIVAGAIQDYDRGLIVGRTTFGKGLVQKQYRLKNGGAVLLTVARYFTPSDRPIQRPYDNDRESYHTEAHDNYDPNSDPDSTAHKPVYYTKVLHRKVFGSGGITPDVHLEPDTLNAFERRLNRQHFFEFGTRNVAEVTREYADFESYLERYKPGRRELVAFKAFLKEQNLAFTDADFRSGQDFILRGIKRQVAHIHWGSRAAGRVLVDQDPEVRRALAVFGQAEKLLAERVYYQGRTHVPEQGMDGQIR